MGTTLGLIIGRAGSKGLPGKNARPIAGRPCAAWTIDDALAATRLDRVALSSDDPDLLALARDAGIDAIARPIELARDDTTVDDAARHAAAHLQDPSITSIAILYANVPVRPEGLIDRAIALLDATGAHSVQSYAPVGKHHPLWTAVVSDAGTVQPWQGDTLNAGIFRRQDLPPAHIPDGGILVVSRIALFLEINDAPPGPHAFLGTDRRGVLTEEGQVIDIDSETDALVAHAILSQRAHATAAPR